jgi:hypothetical protein
MAALGGIVGLAACTDDLNDPTAVRPDVIRPVFFQAANPGVIVEELYLADELEYNDGTGNATREDNGSRIYTVVLDDVLNRANLTLLADLSISSCAGNLPAGVDCKIAFDKVHISASPDGAKVYAVNRFRPRANATETALYTGVPLGYVDVATKAFHWMGMISGLPDGGTVLAANSANGDFYVANATTDRIYRINQSTLAVTASWPVKTLDASNTLVTLDVVGADMAFDSHGTLFLWTNSTNAGQRGLYSVVIDGTNALATRRSVGAPSANGYFTGIAIREAGNGKLLGSVATPTSTIFEIDRFNGAIGTGFRMYLDGALYEHYWGDMTTGRLVIPGTPAIDIEKHTNGEDADFPTGPLVAVGSTVNWTYYVTNTGPVDLFNVTVTDDQGVVVTCPKTTLAVAETMTCTGSGIAVAGQYANIGTATGQYNGTTVHDSDPSHYYGGASPPAPIKCDEGIRDIYIRNIGIAGNPYITVTNSDARKSGEIIWFRGNVQQNTDLSIYPPQATDFHVDARTPVVGKADKKLGSNIFIYVNGESRPRTKIHTACSQPAGPGLLTPDYGPNLTEGFTRSFLVTRAFIVKGGELGANDPSFQDKHFPGKGEKAPVPPSVLQQVIAAGGMFP